MTSTILALDPGTDKLGLAVLAEDGEVLRQGVIPRASLVDEVQKIVKQYNPSVVVMGDGTGAESFRTELIRRKLLPPGCTIILVDEYRTSEEARRKYLAQHRKGWRRIVPIGLQTPPEPYDDYVAVILGQRYLQSSKSGC